MTDRQQRRLAAIRKRLVGHVEMNHAPDRRVLTILGVRDAGDGRAVIDYVDHTTFEDHVRHDEISLDIVPDEDDDLLADMFLQNLIEDLLSTD